MSNGELHAVSAPALPGATVVETGANDGVAKPAPVQHVSDTAGMSESKVAALAFVDANRLAVMKGSDPFLQRKVNQALAHAFGDGPNPEFLTQREQARTDAASKDMRPLSESADDVPIGAELDPIAEGDIATLANRGVIAGQIDRETATETAQFCLAAQLPKAVSNVLVDRVAKHMNDGWGPGELSPADAAELQRECVRSFGSAEKAEKEAALARKYLHSVGGDKLLAEVDKRAGSLAFDPRLILQLSYMARAKGLA